MRSKRAPLGSTRGYDRAIDPAATPRLLRDLENGAVSARIFSARLDNFLRNFPKWVRLREVTTGILEARLFGFGTRGWCVPHVILEEV